LQKTLIADEIIIPGKD